MATVYLNADTGNDSRTYSEAQVSSTPWLTIAKVEASATDGDTVILQDSAAEYAWATVTWTKSFTLQATTLGDAIIDAGGSSTVQWANCRNLTMTNLIFENLVGGSGNPPFETANDASYTLTATNCIFRDITVQAAASNNQGGLFSTQSNHGSNPHKVTLSRCLINITKNASFANTVAVFMTRVTTNTVYTITNCTFYLPGTSGASTQLDGVFSMVSTNTNAAITMKNTIISAPTTAVPWTLTGSFTTTTVTYSDGYNITSFPAGTGNITSDPLFVDEANSNFNLRPTSPCLNTGTLI